jgi:hypothetical protein
MDSLRRHFSFDGDRRAIDEVTTYSDAMLLLPLQTPTTTWHRNELKKAMTKHDKLLDAQHGTAKDLRTSDTMGALTSREFDALFLRIKSQSLETDQSRVNAYLTAKPVASQKRRCSWLTGLGKGKRSEHPE